MHDAEDGVKFWDGFSNGDQLPDGTYYYILHFTIDCDVQEDHNSSGHIQVIN